MNVGATIAPFSLLYLKESLGWYHAVGFALSAAGLRFRVPGSIVMRGPRRVRNGAPQTTTQS
jgi:hypothetical protein